MCANTILPQVAQGCADHDRADEVLEDVTALVAEVFATTPRAGWSDAWVLATEQYDGLIAYAASWDAAAEAQRRTIAAPTDSTQDAPPIVVVGSRWVIYRQEQPYEVVVLGVDLDHRDALCEGCGLYGWVPLAELTEPSPYAQEAAHVAR